MRNVLNEVEDVQATKRIMVAIAYKQGVSQTGLVKWYGLSRKTVYNWLQRFEEKPACHAAQNKAHPGRPPKLDREKQSKVAQLLYESLAKAGYNAENWSIPIVQRLLDEQFNVSYSRTSAYRLLSTIE